MFFRDITSVLLLSSLTIISACRPSNNPAPSSQAALVNALAPQSTPLVTEERQRNVMTVTKWSPRGEHQWAVMPACPKGKHPAGEVGRIQTIAEKYLTSKNLLPTEYHFCISKLDNETWQATCVPSREFLNSPITLFIANGEVQEYHFSDTDDGKF